MNYKKMTLKNGLRIITVPIKGTNAVTVLILVKTGSKYETKDINGISHFLEHMFFKGTKKRPNTLDIAATLDKIGGEYNAFTSKEMTGFWAKVDKKHINVALDWISDMFLNSKFEQQEIDREKGVIIEELNMYLDTPTVYVEELFESLLYKDQPAGWRIVGEKENILALNRQKIVDYYENHYSSANTIVCIAGDIGERARKRAGEYFSAERNVPPAKKEKVRESQTEPGMLLHFKKTDQTHFCLGVRTFDMFYEKKYAISLMAVILGGNMSSRLFINLRERNGLCYHVHTHADFTTDTGYLMTQAGIDSKNLEKSVELILKEYKSLASTITSEELQKAKDYMKGALSLSLESSDSQASFYANQELFENKIMTLDEKFAKIDLISIEDIKEVSQKIFTPERLNLAVIGPIDEKEHGIKIRRLLADNF